LEKLLCCEEPLKKPLVTTTKLHHELHLAKKGQEKATAKKFFVFKSTFYARID
jgi:hypothetical protein